MLPIRGSVVLGGLTLRAKHDNEYEVMLNPRSVAVVGASRIQGKVGHAILKNIVDGGYQGRIYPVNPNAERILGLRCYPKVSDIGDKVDMAVIVVPAEKVLEVAEDCGLAGVKMLVVISAGFKEIGIEGAKRERELLTIARKYGMRVLGPNCFGYINTSIGLNVTFASSMPPKGHISFISQSGALVSALIDRSHLEGMAFSKIVSLGNKSDLDEVDYIRFLVNDPETRVIILYLEGIGRGEEFVRVAREASTIKPVIALKSGVTEAGIRAVSSHTGSLAGSEVAYNIAFKQFGVVKAETLSELFDLAMCFESQPIPKHGNVVIVTNAGGPGILAADMCGRMELKLAELGAEIDRKLREILPPAASTHNPIDVLGDAGTDRYEAVLKILLEREDLDSFIVILAPQAMTDPDGVARLLVDFKAKNPNKAIVASFMGGRRTADAVSILRRGGIPNYDTPEKAARALAGLIRYMDIRRRQGMLLREGYPRYPIDKEAVREVLSKVKEEGRNLLMPNEACEVLKACSIRATPCILAKSPEEAVEAAETMGYPVVLKVASPHITHKSDVGGVKMNLMTPSDVKLAYYDIIASVSRFVPGAMIYGVIVTPMAPKGKEVIIGMHRDPQFGPLIMFGLGGIYVELMRDVSFRLAPLTRSEALEMIMETKAYRLLKGFRSEPPGDIEAVIDTILKVSVLALEFKEIQEIDINPLFVYERFKGCLVVDSKIWW
ncbi:MAG: acetate--CoA ligase family protein [Nitrososphaerota archaeon]|nr:acetate--CoA ligase family protein [Candidatus Nezhaarchaeota archaeon]MDW8049609.1 acetate--CoA ligase family protein [Nitrososphaerota archaeon]